MTKDRAWVIKYVWDGVLILDTVYNEAAFASSYAFASTKTDVEVYTYTEATGMMRLDIATPVD